MIALIIGVAGLIGYLWLYHVTYEDVKQERQKLRQAADKYHQMAKRYQEEIHLMRSREGKVIRLRK